MRIPRKAIPGAENQEDTKQYSEKLYVAEDKSYGSS